MHGASSFAGLSHRRIRPIWREPASRFCSIVPLFEWARVNFLRVRLFGNGRVGLLSCPSRQVGASSDQPRTTLVGGIGPCPLNKDQQAVAETDEKQDVNEE